MKFRLLPAIITLLAGLIVCIFTMVCQYEIQESLWLLVGVMTLFYVIGMIIRKLLNISFREDEKAALKEKEEAESKEDNNETIQSQEGSVHTNIEKK